MYRVALRRSFKARHRLIGGDWGMENELHAHDYEVEVTLEGARLDEHGYLVDITAIEVSLDAILARIAETTLNDLPEFAGLNPSIERLAEIFCRSVLADMALPTLSAVSVKVFESGSAWGRLSPKSPMNIGLIIYGSVDLISGGYLYDRFLVDHLRKQGARVEILSLPWRNYLCHLTDNFTGTLPRAVEAITPDLLLQDELNHPSLFHTNRKLQETLMAPIIAIVHHLRCSEARPAWLNRLYRLVEKCYLETADGFIFNSETTRAVTRDVLGRDPPCVVAHPGGDHLGPTISTEKIVERCRRPGPLRILFTGNVIPRKGLYALVLALSRLAHESWQLTVAGSLSADARYVRRIGRLIASTGLAEQVKLLDTVSREQLVGLLESHHCLAVPSFYEGFGIVYLEAMGFGMPVIASTAGAVPEVVDDGREGFLVTPGDVDALTEEIGRLIRDRNLLLAMSLAARKRSLGHPTWAQSAARVEEFLQEMIKLKKSAANKGRCAHNYSR